ncbi:hypothetical protein DJ021_00910 [Phenylobacterium hankyongense]|uniref:Uncharacterized protein n=1 Tax=Phenylobacterium hankyongense TaxID=1813876 RepID=A0A328B9D5_9CAUL|nr:hypothetical protein DJ021_00910 [Phenylobacterium hankyongense]
MVVTAGVHQFRPPDDPTDDGGGTPSPYGGFPNESEDLPYRVEVWDPDGRFVEQVVAVSLSPAIGYAAFYAASREFPGRAITLRHKSAVLSRWSGQAH